MRFLAIEGRLTTGEACERLGISQATARRLFLEMEDAGKLVRTYGGVQLLVNQDSYQFEQHEKVFEQEKRRIGETAAALVEDRDTVYLDCGTTLFQMAIALGDRLRRGNFTDLNIVTNSIANLQALGDFAVAKVILLGGEYHTERRDFFGPVTERYIEPFHFDKCFLGCEGVSAENGYASNRTELSSLNACVLRRSRRRHALLDVSKFEKGAFFSYASFGEIDEVVTGAPPPDAVMLRLYEAGAKVHIASPGYAKKEGDSL